MRGATTRPCPLIMAARSLTDQFRVTQAVRHRHPEAHPLPGPCVSIEIVTEHSGRTAAPRRYPRHVSKGIDHRWPLIPFAQVATNHPADESELHHRPELQRLPVGGLPVKDSTQFCGQLDHEPGLLPNFAHRALLRRLAELHNAAGQSTRSLRITTWRMNHHQAIGGLDHDQGAGVVRRVVDPSAVGAGRPMKLIDLIALVWIKTAGTSWTEDIAQVIRRQSRVRYRTHSPVRWDR